jgi:hypothetical protein
MKGEGGSDDKEGGADVQSVHSCIQLEKFFFIEMKLQV